jgi:hypothetical protein
MLCALCAACLLACLQASLAAHGAQLESCAAELEQYKERLRKGRFHIINEQVQQAKVSHTHYAGAALPAPSWLRSAGACS